MEFKLLGSLEITQDGRQAPALARAKEQCLLAVLAMNVGRTLSAGELIYYVWDDDNPPESTFRSYLTHVRGLLAATDGRAHLVTDEAGYQLRADPASIDLHHFRHLREQADAAARAGNLDRAVALLCEAEALWRGPALAGLPGRWVAAMRISLEEELRACIKRRAGLELDLGRHAELAGELHRLCARYPFDETFVAYKMTALYLSGRQADALATYRDVRARFAGQGIEPGAELAALHQQILNRDPRLSRTSTPRRPASPDPPTVIPVPTAAFVGRAEEIRALTASGPGSSQVYLISGMPGVGKTRLAIEAARRLADRFRDGQAYVEFNTHQAPEAQLSVDAALRRLLETTAVRVPAVPQGRLAALWQEEIAGRQMIIVLDDVPDIDAATPLLPQAGDSVVFITARQRLHSRAGIRVVQLDVLPEHDAITLFRRTAGTGKTGDPEAVVRAVRLCGCLPLAVTLAASRLKDDNGPSTVVELVEDIMQSGAIPAGDSGAGGQLLSALEASYKALSASQQRFFRLLGLSPCLTFTAESAAAIVGVPIRQARETAGALLNRNLVEPAAGDRLRFHDLLRTYAAMCAQRDDSGSERREAGRRLLDYYLHQADHADRDLYPYRDRAAVPTVQPPTERPEHDQPANSREWLESEQQNILRAAEYADRHEWKRRCAELAHILSEHLDITGCSDEGVSTHSQALRACRDLGEQSLTARALIDLSRACQQKGMHQPALAYAREALEIYRSAGDWHGAALAADRMGVTCYYVGKFREALAHKQEARVLYAQSGDTAGEAEAIFHCGISCMSLGRLRESLEHFREALTFFTQSGNQHWMAKALNSIAEISLRQGYHRDAIDNYQKALSIYRAMGARQEYATVMQNIGRVHLYKGNPGRALTEFRCALATYREIRDLPWQPRVMCDIGDAYLTITDYRQCLVYYQEAAAIAQRLGDLYTRAVALRGIGDAHRNSDSHEEAMRFYQDALKIIQEIEEPYLHAVILDGVAQTMLRTGQLSAGRIYLRQALDLYKASGAIEAAATEIRLQTLGN